MELLKELEAALRLTSKRTLGCKTKSWPCMHLQLAKKMILKIVTLGSFEVSDLSTSVTLHVPFILKDKLPSCSTGYRLAILVTVGL